MKVYPVTDAELRSLEDSNAQANIFGSASTTAFGSAVTLWADSKIEAPSTGIGQLLLAIGPWIMVSLGVVFGVLWLIALRRRKTVIGEVRSSAVEAQVVQAK